MVEEDREASLEIQEIMIKSRMLIVSRKDLSKSQSLLKKDKLINSLEIDSTILMSTIKNHLTDIKHLTLIMMKEPIIIKATKQLHSMKKNQFLNHSRLIKKPMRLIFGEVFFNQQAVSNLRELNQLNALKVFLLRLVTKYQASIIRSKHSTPKLEDYSAAK